MNEKYQDAARLAAVFYGEVVDQSLTFSEERYKFYACPLHFI